MVQPIKPPPVLSDQPCECGCGQMTLIMWRSDTRWGHVRGQPLRFVKGHNCRIRAPGEPWGRDLPHYNAVHYWVSKNKPKTGVCEICEQDVGKKGSRGTQMANRSQQYLWDLDDYMELCRRCHRRYDLGLPISL